MDWQEFLKKFDAAMAKFNQQSTDYEAIKGELLALQQKVTAIASMRMERDDRVGFSDPGQAKEFIRFIKALYDRDATEIKSMTEGSDEAGGYLVHPEQLPVLIRLIESFGLIRQKATVIPMGKDEMNVPRLTTGVIVYWPDEGAEISDGSPVTGNLKMTAKKMASLVPCSSELLEDSSIEIANLLAVLFTEAVAAEEDRVGLAGKKTGGTDPFDGILYDSSVAAVTMTGTGFSGVDADDLADVCTSVTSAAAKGAEWFLHRTIFNIVRKLKDDQGNYIYQAPAAGQPGTIWAYPYNLTDQMPSLTDTAAGTPFIAFGNLKNFYLGDRRRLSMAQSIHAAFKYDNVWFRMTERVALHAAIPAAFAVLKTASGS